jgi:hypothetical protein
MILIGSLAAKITNTLPNWRDGAISDIDLVGSLLELQNLILVLKSIYEPVIIHETSIPGRFVIIVPLAGSDRILIEFNSNTTVMTDILKIMPDNIDTQIFGLHCKAISFKSQYAIKKAYRDVPIAHQEKNKKDLAYWKKLIDSPYLPEHVELFKAMWNEKKEIFKDE